MYKEGLPVDQYAGRNRRHRIWKRFVSVLGCVVMFCTTYALILPAITMERDCGVEEHIHGDACFAQVTAVDKASMNCMFPHHAHTADCGENCGYADFVVHRHGNYCYSDDARICTLPEILEHTHVESCYQPVHTHGDACYELTLGELTCKLDETEGHDHGENCFEKILICQTEEQEAHTHEAGCYTVETKQICTLEESDSHVHDESCVEEVTTLVCSLPEQQGYAHSESCYEQTLACTEEETEGHKHGETCYEQLRTLICQQDTQAMELICGKDEIILHTHEDACFDSTDALICGKTEVRVHTHEDACVEMVSTPVDTESLSCTLPENENHTHGSRCYGTWELVCTLQEHTHTDECRSVEATDPSEPTGATDPSEPTEATDPSEPTEATDPSEPTEATDPSEPTEATDPSEPPEEVDWTASFSDAELTGDWGTDVVIIAQTQLDYKEITEDDQAAEAYTLYGDWYGDPHGDWSAMFASFCLHHAGVEGMPFDSDCANWVQALTSLELYSSAAEYTPSSGDLVFFDNDADGISDQVGIVQAFTPTTETEAGSLEVIQGDVDGQVVSLGYAPDSGNILGYGMLPVRAVEDDEADAEEPQFITALSYTGADYKVNLRFDESAKIPANAELSVRELSGEEYQKHLTQTYEAIDSESTHTLVQFAGDGETVELQSGDSNVLLGKIRFARFFDLTILSDGEEIEPEDTVEVTIRFDSSVEIPEGTKTAVHFNKNGEIEVLDAQAAAVPAARYNLKNARAKTAETQQTDGESFVFLQDSFSVTGTVSLDKEYDFDDSSIKALGWFCGKNTLKTLTVYANFGEDACEKSITIKVPTGLRILTYSANKAEGSTPVMDGVTKVDIDNEYKNYILTSTLLPATTSNLKERGAVIYDKDGNGNPVANAWETQRMVGYTGSESDDVTPIRTHGGDIVYHLADTTQTVKVVVTMQIDQSLLSHGKPLSNAEGVEVMEPIRVTVSKENEGSKEMTIIPVAQSMPVVTIHPGNGGTQKNYNAPLESEIEGRSGLIPVGATIFNFLAQTAETDSYFEEAEFILTYPKGVFLEPGTIYCQPAGYKLTNPITAELTRYPYDPENPGKSTGAPNKITEGHLWIKWEEDENNGGGTIIWTLKNGTMTHAGNAESVGAQFRARTTPNREDSNPKEGIYGPSEVIGVVTDDNPKGGITLTLSRYRSNGYDGVVKTIPYLRTLIAGETGKDVRIEALNRTRRDITTHFNTDAYDYALGGFNVVSALDYDGNTFYFENTENLNITALNLPGKKVRDITVWIASRNSSAGSIEYPGVKPGQASCMTRTITIPGPLTEPTEQYGGKTVGTLLNLANPSDSKLGNDVLLAEGEYIKACLFTSDLVQGTYDATHEFGSFVYIGQFPEGREGETVLRLLQDETDYEQVAEAIQNIRSESVDAVTFDTLTTVNTGSDLGNPIEDTDHTTIGWTETGVGAATAEVFNASTNAAATVYYPNETLKFKTSVRSGYNFKHQDTLIDPTLVITLPEGVELDTGSVTATSKAGSKNGATVTLEMYSKEKVVDAKGITHYVYRYGVSDADRLALVAIEPMRDGGVHNETGIITATFQATVDSACPQYDLSLQNVIMWDVRNVGYNGSDPPAIPAGSAVGSHWSSSCTGTDANNFIGNGTDYGVAKTGNMFVIKPLIGLNVDLAITPMDTGDTSVAASGHITYNGMSNSIAPVVPGKYADVKLTYKSSSDSEYFAGTVIYVPIPKKDNDYSHFFQNAELENPMSVSKNKLFEFDMDLLGPVTLYGYDKDQQAVTTWETRYALAAKSQPHSSSGSGANEQGSWAPVEETTWYTADQISNMDAWADVVMLRFTVTGSIIPPGGNGVANMRLYVHDIGDEAGTAAGEVNYWRGYGKAVTKEETGEGNWKYTSVVAATPAMETVVGQIFVDNKPDGLYAAGEGDGLYTAQKYSVRLFRKTDSGSEVFIDTLAVQSDGSFALLDGTSYKYLQAGDYIVKIKDDDANFSFANTEYNGSVGSAPYRVESPENAWHNNVKSGDDASATWHFTVTNTATDGNIKIHRLGIGVKTSTTAVVEGFKTMEGGPLKRANFKFILKDENGAAIGEATNLADGTFKFPSIAYDQVGTYLYTVEEDTSETEAGIIYDPYEVAVTVTVSGNQDGTLKAEVSYEKDEAAWSEADKARTDVAAFTNRYAYELPKTGGVGTTPYAMGGALLMAAAVTLLGYQQKAKRRKEENASS